MLRLSGRSSLSEMCHPVMGRLADDSRAQRDRCQSWRSSTPDRAGNQNKEWSSILHFVDLRLELCETGRLPVRDSSRASSGAKWVTHAPKSGAEK